MTPIADMIEHMVAGGVAMDLILVAVRAAELSRGNSGGIPVDSAAEKRRAYDRARKAKPTNSTGVSTGIPPECKTPLTIEKKERGRGERIPPEWKPSPPDLEFALSKGMPRPRIDNEAERFRNYWTAKAGKTATKLDWSATWRNWVLQSLERHPPPNGTGGSGAGDSWLEAIR